MPHAHAPGLSLASLGELIAFFPYPGRNLYLPLGGLRLLLAIVLFVGLFLSGLGLRRSRPWARLMTIALGILITAAGAGSCLLEFGWARPHFDQETQLLLAPGPAVIKTADGRTILKPPVSVTRMNQQLFLTASNRIVIFSACLLLYGAGLLLLTSWARLTPPGMGS